MRARHIVLACVALSALGGCSSGDDAAPKTDVPMPGVSASAAVAPSASSSVDTGLYDATSAYLTALAKIDQKLVGDREKALNGGQTICLDIQEKKTAAEVEKSTAAHFAVDATRAKQIAAVAKANLCLAQ